jgi:DNA (cytosine-5)-methyltransferase 1
MSVLFEVIDKVIHDTSGDRSLGDVTDRPCPTITVAGTQGLPPASCHFKIHYHLTESPPSPLLSINETPGKPSYRVPTMAEIASVPSNGYSVISTFSGCGGSCLGYRMAGFKVLWANEFIRAARDTYRANHSDCFLDARDIRKIQPSEILDAIDMNIGEIDLLDGSPPCASFSTAGKRSAGWGRVKPYSDTKQRTDDLFFEYARLLRGLQPKVFVAENVSGLVKGTAKGYFLEILKSLKDCGYNVKAKVLDAQWLGVPQMRQRLIFIGVRNDFHVAPAHPKPLAYRYSVRDAIPWIQSVSCLLPGKKPGKKPGNESCPTVTVGDTGGNGRHSVEAETDISRYAIGREWDEIAPGQTSDKYIQLSRPSLDGPCPAVTFAHGVLSSAGVIHPTEKRRFSIAELRRICAFPDDFILTGTYSQQWERLGRAVPPVMMAAIASTIRDEVLSRCAVSSVVTDPR